ncbi:hypothetical protein PG985_014433 [Apiospora marii]|uniref:uncharacterized protein n=1 Tax=Apiospora marii TaxID=335849 RepID=UPI003131136F
MSRLSSLAGVSIIWTDNLSRHLLLSKTGQKHCLDLLALPCALQGRTPEDIHKTGLLPSLVYEVQSTYANLFNPAHMSSIHSALVKYTGFRYLLVRGLRIVALPGPRDQGAVSGALQEARSAWVECPDPVEFCDLWPRILELDHHLQAARPWNFWILFRDNRDTVQYWTFLFGTIILFLTVVQVALGAAQVAGSG